MFRFQSVGRMSLVVVIALLSIAVAAPEASAQCRSLTMSPQPGALPAGAVGVDYPNVTFVPSGGKEPYKFSLAAGAFPPGLSVTPDRATGNPILNGVPTTAGSFSFTINVDDASGICTGNFTYTIAISGKGSCTFPVSPTALPIATVGDAYEVSLGGEGAPPYVFTASGLPSGLSILKGTLIAGTPTQSGKFSVSVNGTDAKGCTGSANYTLTVNCPPLAISGGLVVGRVGTAYSDQISVKGISTYTFAIASGAPPAGLSLATNGVVSGTPTTPGTSSFVVRATDTANGCSDTQTVSIKICDNIIVNPASLPGGTVSSSYSATLSASGGTAPYAFTMAGGSLPTGLTLSGSTISGTPTTAGTFSFTINANDGTNCGGQRGYTVTIANPAPTCPAINLPTSLPNGTTGQTYTGSIAATGSKAIPYTYAVVKGVLPAGLALSGDSITGTPTTAGPFTFTISATDTNKCSGNETYSITIAEGCPRINVGPASLPGGTVKNPYKATLTATGGAAPYTYALVRGSSMPAGLTIEGDAIVGIPTAVGSFSFDVVATDAKGCDGLGRFNITVTEEACPTISFKVDLPAGQVGAGYKGAFLAGGGAEPYKYGIAGGFLPPGLSLDGSTIVGTPTAQGLYKFTINAQDAKGCAGSTAASIEIAAAPGCPTLTVNPLTLPNGTAGLGYKASVGATGGAEPYTYGVSAGSLPPGLDLSGDTLFGTPTTAGTFNFTIAVTDAKRCSGSRAYTIVIAGGGCPTINVGPSLLPSGTTGTPYKGVSLTATGGLAPYAFSVSAGSLPAGLSLSGNTIGGTPTTAGSFKFEVTATDANRCSGSATYIIDIEESGTTCSIQVSPAALPNGTVGSTYKVGLAASGGAIPYNFEIVGSLPPGLSLSGDTIFGNPTTAGTFRFDVRISDSRRCATSVSYSLTIAPPISACGTGDPSNVAPQPDQEFSDVTSITYAWNGVKGATGYDVLLSGDGGRSFGVEVSTSGELATKVSAPAKAGKFIWFVRANFGPDCKPTVSTQSVFSVVTSSICPRSAPTQIQPANNATNVSTTVVFEWTAVEGASQYTVIGTMNGESTALATTNATIVKVAVKPGKISWKVRAEFLSRCPATESSSLFTFDTEQPVVCSLSPTKARLIAPANGASGVASPVTFEWAGVTGATSYNVYALIDTGLLLESTKPQLLGSTTDTKLSTTVPEGTITWYVETMFGRCPSSISDTFVFKSAAGSRCDNPPTTLNAPVGNATVSSPVTFSWTPMKGAVNYQLFIAFNGSTTFSKVIDTPESSFTQRIGPGTHSWFIATEFFGCKPVPSTPQTFTVAAEETCPSDPAPLRSPANGSTVTSPVTFDWVPVSGVPAYLFTVAVNGVTVVNEKVAGPPQTREISSGSVSWSITPLSGTCKIPPSSGTFTVQARNTCDTNAPAAPQSPSGARFEVSGTAASVDFRWNAAPNAIGYTVEVALPRQAFGEIGATKGNDATALTRELKPGVYSWRVLALFAGCTPVPSEVRSFEIVDVGQRCSAATPGLIFPAAGARDVTSPTTFLWSSVPDAIAYRVYLNGGLLTNPDLDASRTSFTATLSPGPATWAVEAVFKSCSANKAADVSFTVQQATVCPSDKPELVFPGRDAENVSQLVEFSWKPISGATNYTLFTKTDAGTATSAAETTLTSARAKMPSGQRIEWYVVASVPGCKAVESDHSFFTTAADCSDRGPILQSPLSDSRDLGSPVSFSWTSVPNSLEYNLWIGDRNDKNSIRLVTTTRATKASIDLDAGAYIWFVESVLDKCPSVPSAVAFFTVAATQGADCKTPDQPIAHAVGQVLSETAYNFRWTPVLNAQSYEVQESATADFAAPQTFPVNENELKFVHAVSTPATFYYRVRAISRCNDDRSQFSPVVEVDVVSKDTIDKKTLGTAEIGVEQVVIQTLFIPGGDTPTPFTATVDRPWMTVVPSSGIVPLEGLTLNVTADPAFLGVGSNVGTVLISYGGAGKLGQQTSANGPTNVPVNVSLVTPVVPGGKNGPQLDSLIIPAVGHAQGANNSLFQSDVRVVNTSTQTMKYQLNFTPSRSDATVTGRSTTIQIEPGGTAALDDILTSFFGTAATETATGALEIRPLTSSATSTSSRATSVSLASPTVASSRTYNLTANGTLGQFIPAIPFASFIGKNSDGTRALLSLQQIAESNAYRTNFGLVEGSGQPASGLMSVYDSLNSLVAEIPFNLQAGEHQQLDRLLANNNISLEEGRIEVEVTSATGKVTAYASTIDNRTNDPLLVTPVLKSAITGTRYVVPGVAFIDGPAKWRSDVRIYNAANTEQSATVTFFPQGNTDAAQSQEVSLKPGEVLALDNVLVTMFGASSTIGGSLLVSTPQTSSLVATARTYAVTEAGTYGQFVPAVTANESTAMGGRALNILQVEQSINMRTNIGLVETTGKSAMAEVTLILPDSKFSSKVQIPLPANGFTQFNLASFNVGNAVYNARVSVKVISGSGRVAAYGSVIDNKTLDPTYVPAQ